MVSYDCCCIDTEYFYNSACEFAAPAGCKVELCRSSNSSHHPGLGNNRGRTSNILQVNTSPFHTYLFYANRLQYSYSRSWLRLGCVPYLRVSSLLSLGSSLLSPHTSPTCTTSTSSSALDIIIYSSHQRRP